LTPLVSILMPAYNHAAYVTEAVRSVLEQDHPRIELIVVDDGSRDGTPDVLRGLLPACERRCERVVLECRENRGTCHTVNRLMDLARGEYCLVLASDDRLMPGALTALLKPMLEDPAVGVTVGENEFMDAEGRHCYWTAGQRTTYVSSEGTWSSLNAYVAHSADVDRFGVEFGTYAALMRANHVANGCLIRHAALDRCAHLTPEAPLEDYWLHMQLSKVTRYRSVREVTFRYRWHATNTAKAVNRMVAMTRQTLEHEYRRFAADLAASDRQALEAALSFWRGRCLLAFVRRSEARTLAILRSFDTCVDAVPVPDGGAALCKALAAAALERYGYVAYLEDERFIPDGADWKRLLRCFRDCRAEIVAGRSSFVARASALARNGLETARLRRPGLWRRLGNFIQRRFR